MRVLVCGDRKWKDRDRQIVFDRLDQLAQAGLLIIQGGCTGADALASYWASWNNVWELKCPALWDAYGNAAGPIRNQRMLDEGRPDLVIAFHADIEHSLGTKDMVARARKAGVPVEVITGREPERS